MSKIHQTAVIDPSAELASEVEIGPYAVIGAGVKLGKATQVRSHVVIEGRTSIGENNIFFPTPFLKLICKGSH